MIRAKTYILLLVLIGLGIYINVLFNSFIGDDFLQIVNNNQVHSLSNIVRFFTGSTYETGGTDKIAGLFYRPLMLVSFALLYHFFHLNTSVFHLFQILLHISNAVLLYLFLKYFFKNTVAFFISLIFLLHPINNEAVVYSANLQEVLLFFFGIISLLLIQNLKPLSLRGGTTKQSLLTMGLPRSFQSLAVSFFVLLSLLSKESGILFLIITLTYSAIYKKAITKYLLITHTIITLIYLILRYPIAKMHLAQGSITPLYNAPLGARVLQIPAIFFYYLKTFLYPVSISSHHFWIIKNLNFYNFYFPFLILTISLSSILFFAFQFARHNSKSTRHYVFFSIWFLSGMLLHLQIYPLDMTVADRWFYFPIVGLLSLIALVIVQVKFRSLLLKRVGIFILILVLIFLAVRTHLRNLDWKDELTLFGRDIKATPKNFVLDNLYATALITDGQIKKAKPYVESSIKEYPYYANLNNMAIIYASEGNYKSAKKYLKRATIVSKFYVIYENYANFLLAYDNLAEAESFTEKALAMFPRNSKLWLIQAKIQYIKGDRKLAIQSAEKAYSLSPSKQYLEVFEDIKSGKLQDPGNYVILKK